MKYLCRAVCILAGAGAIADSFSEGFSWFTVFGIVCILSAVIDIVKGYSISNVIGGIMLLPFFIVIWLIQGIVSALFTRPKRKVKPFGIEEMFFYDMLFGDK